MGGANQGIAAFVHWRRAGMRRFPAQVDVHTEAFVSADDDSDRDFLRFEDWPLLDVQFVVGIDFAPAYGLRPGITDPFQLVAERFAVVVGQGEDPIDVEDACKGAGGDHGRGKAGAFFVGPVGDFDGPKGLDAALVQGADRLQPRQDPKNAVIASARGLAIEV